MNEPKQREIKFRFVEDFNTRYAKVWELNEDGIKACMAANKDDQYGHTVDEYLWGILFNGYPNVRLIEFTGLHDKNGKEIYEGDIVSDGGVVVFGGGRYFVRYDSDRWEDLIGDSDNVIGNIYQK